MNVEFHYYSTAFLAVKAGFPLEEATTLAFAGQYVDHHHRTLEIRTGDRTVLSHPTQNFSFWDRATVAHVLAPFHFFPAGATDSVRNDGATSVWDVRPNSPPVKRLLVEALKTRDLYRVGLALHTFSDTWAHQNFTARDEAWNRLDASNRLPSPGHVHAGFDPDLWLSVWDDTRLTSPRVVNVQRFADCARKVYRYLCTFRGKDFKQDEDAVADELGALVAAGRGREVLEDRVMEYVLALNLEPYDRSRWLAQALEPSDQTPTGWPLLDKMRKAGDQLLDKAGLSGPQQYRARPGFDTTPLASWIRAAEDHRRLARSLIAETTGEEP